MVLVSASAHLHLSLYLDAWPAIPVAWRVLGYTLSYFIQFLLFTGFVYFVYLFLCVSQPKTVPWGCAIWTHDMTSDWVALGSPSSHYQDSVDRSDCRSQQLALEASSDRHSVAVALSSLL